MQQQISSEPTLSVAGLRAALSTEVGTEMVKDLCVQVLEQRVTEWKAAMSR
jgi:hypothetical protein